MILSLSLGPALKIGITEPLILGVVAALIWGSFFIGVRNSTELKNEVQINEEEWDKEEQEEISKEKIAIPEESITFQKEDVAPEAKIDEKKDDLPVSKDVKDRLADLKSEFKKTKKRSAELGVRDKKRQ